MTRPFIQRGYGFVLGALVSSAIWWAFTAAWLTACDVR